MLRAHVEHETPLTALNRAELARSKVSPTLDRGQRTLLGQFMTPAAVASFVAQMFGALPKRVRLLDPGAGLGALTAAFVDDVCRRTERPDAVDVTAFEVDSSLAEVLRATLAACAEDCAKVGVEFTWRVIEDDYLLFANEPLILKSDSYNCAILNPPYAKMSSTSKTRVALRSLGIETSNLYTAFVAVALNQLVSGGQLVAITPRSFCNGSYFDSFRRRILDESAIHQIHVYESRKRAFSDDEVLQENIIYKLVRGEPQPDVVRISSSTGPHDPRIMSQEVPFQHIVLPSDPHRYIRLLTSAADQELAEKVLSLPCTLRQLGLSVSTGRVVDFRARDYLRKHPETGTVPLVYPAHFQDGFVSWPKLECRKHNAIVADDVTADLLVPKGTYVLTKRFTSKEEKRRLVAAVYDPQRIAADYVGFENHLNYFHHHGVGLSADLAKGLALFLNSTALDLFFRQFSGHTQVNATDLRNLRYPHCHQLEDAGRKIGSAFPSQKEIDAVVHTLLS